MSVAAYRSAAGTSAVTASEQTAGTASGTSHTTPRSPWPRPVPGWSAPGARSPRPTPDWTPPATSTTRATPAATGGGKVSSLLADSGAPVATGTAAGRTATTSAAGGGSPAVLRRGQPRHRHHPAGQQPAGPVVHLLLHRPDVRLQRLRHHRPRQRPADLRLELRRRRPPAPASPPRARTPPPAPAPSRSPSATAPPPPRPPASHHEPHPDRSPPAGAGPHQAGPRDRSHRPAKISNGEIFDIKIVGSRVFIAGSFTTHPEPRPTNTTTYTRNGLASYNLTTGLVDAGFNPRFTGGAVDAIAFTPDSTKLFVTGNFSAVNGIARRGLARSTSPPAHPWPASSPASAPAAPSWWRPTRTVYVGGRFTTVNNVSRSQPGRRQRHHRCRRHRLREQPLRRHRRQRRPRRPGPVLTHDQSKLLVVHTGTQVAGQDRYGVAMISIATKQLLPWRTKLWEDNLQFVGGIQRAYGADISPDDSYFVVTSGSGGDRPPINDTAMAFPLEGGTTSRPSGSPAASTASTPWPSPSGPSTSAATWAGTSPRRLRTRGQVSTTSATAPARASRATASATPWSTASTSRALNPVDGQALEWNPGSNSYEGNKAMELTPRGLFTGGDATTQAGANIGRIAFFDFNSIPASNGVETAITEPIEGRVNPVGPAVHRPGHGLGGERHDQPGRAARLRPGGQPLPGRQPDHVADHVQHHQHHAAEHRRPYGELVASADHHRQPQAAAASPDVLLGRHRRQHPGDEEDRDLRPDRPAAGHQRHRSVLHAGARPRPSRSPAPPPTTSACSRSA